MPVTRTSVDWKKGLNIIKNKKIKRNTKFRLKTGVLVEFDIPYVVYK